MTESEPYLTVAQNNTAELVIERSRFIGHCFEVATEEYAKKIIAQIREEHARANHNCFAYRIGHSATPTEYFNDHGEPNGTAGKPILGAITRLKLTDTLVVVTRYFGGKKLGVRGLIDAYGQTATNVLEQSGIITRIPKFEAVLTYNYSEHALLLHRIQAVEAEIADSNFSEIVRTKLSIPLSYRDNFEKLLSELPSIKCEYL